MANRFEQVDEEQPDALNLVLAQSNQGQVGSVRIHASAMPGNAPGGVDSGEIAAKDAFRAAIKLANEMKLAIVVVDPDNVWDKEWGELYRWEDEEGDEAPTQ